MLRWNFSVLEQLLGVQFLSGLDFGSDGIRRRGLMGLGPLVSDLGLSNNGDDMQKMKRKFVIVGQGLAGSVLSMIMRDRGIPHRVVDFPGFSQSSRIAAGIANPIVLKRLKWVKDGEIFWPAMRRFYEVWDAELAGASERAWRPLAMLHRFNDPGEVNLWEERSQIEPFRGFLGDLRGSPKDHWNVPYGWGQLRSLYWLHTSSFLERYRKLLRSWGLLQEKELEVPAKPSSIWPPGLEKGEEIIFCNGHLARNFTELEPCFAATRGELITVKAPELGEDRAFHGGVFAIPLGEELFKIGASYGHDRLADRPTEEGRAWLERQWRKMYQGPYEVVDHQAGVRPTVRDRKPLLGTIRPGIHLFNGLGSRGVMMAPFLGAHFLDHLVEGKSLAQPWDWRRFT